MKEGKSGKEQNRIKNEEKMEERDNEKRKRNNGRWKKKNIVFNVHSG